MTLMKAWRQIMLVADLLSSCMEQIRLLRRVQIPLCWFTYSYIIQEPKGQTIIFVEFF